jgi:hypothetical protein
MEQGLARQAIEAPARGQPVREGVALRKKEALEGLPSRA